MNNIDSIVYINLDKRTDRKIQIEEELNRMNLIAERFSGIEYPPEKGWVGCLSSHTNVLKNAMEKRVKNILVLEDDFYWKIENRDALDKAVQSALDLVPNYDVLMFDYCIQKSQPYNELLGKVIESSTASAYLVNGHYIPILYHCLNEAVPLAQKSHPHTSYLYINDQYWKRLQPYGKWYYFLNKLGYQRNGYSNINNSEVVHTY